MIRPASAQDIAAIDAAYTELLLHEREHGTNSHWELGVYPTRATAERAVAAGTMYVLEEEGQLRASMILNSYQAPEYRRVPWLYPAEDGEVLVIHTLCVPPSQARRGLGARMVAFAADYARRNSKCVIRLDTNAENRPAQALYLNNGFRLSGRLHCLHEGVLDTELVYLERKL